MPAVKWLSVAAACGLLPIGDPALGQTVWGGPFIVFTKPDLADPMLPENQDHITDAVVITRGMVAGLYNIAIESFYGPLSPADTEWAYGHAANWESLTFQPWVLWHGNNPPSTIGQDAVVHLVSEDIYIDIRILSWSCCGAGGFSYQRSTPGSPGSCYTVTSEEVTCSEDNSSFTFTVHGIESCTGGPSTFTFTAAGGEPGALLCFDVVISDAGGGLCCITKHCATIPECGAFGGPCDVDGDDVVGMSDLLALLGAWGSKQSGPPDLDEDGVVGIGDLLELLATWGPCSG